MHHGFLIDLIFRSMNFTRMKNILNGTGLIHGCDYNPEQWEDIPDIWEEDYRLMRQAGINGVALGIFAWSRLEPVEGQYDFDWMAKILDRLHETGVSVWLATPSGAKPNWLGLKYPEVRRCQANGQRDLQASRHNHCPSSPVYRAKVAAINGELSKRFGRHPAVSLWHISNEYNGDCHCPLCLAAFHRWLEKKYGTVDAMNRAWWSRFWSHTYDGFDQVTCIDGSVSGLAVDWKRFVSDQTVDFMEAEVAAVREHSDLPVTTNVMGFFEGLDSARIARVCDVVGWDCYPDWHGDLRVNEQQKTHRPFDGMEGDALVASEVAFLHDLHRGLKDGQPWLLMESTPSNIIWRPASRLKEPGVNRLAGLQAVAHGADAVAYFQWRAGLGSCEAFHGSVVGHAGQGDTRVFREVSELSRNLSALAPLAGARVSSQAALIYDWEVRWHWEIHKHSRNADKDYPGTCVQHYRPLWRRSVGCDVIGGESSLDAYRLVIAPALYMLRPGQAEQLAAFVERGGTLLCTAPTGVVDAHDLAFSSGRPGPLRRLFGVWAEEMEALSETGIGIEPVAGDPLGLGCQRGESLCELLHAEDCEVLATCAETWYAGRPILTRRRHGAGWAYYLGTRGTPALLDALIPALAAEAGIRPPLTDLPSPVTSHSRADHRFYFNWGREARKVVLPEPGKDLLAASGEPVSEILLPAWGAAVIAPSGGASVKRE